LRYISLFIITIQYAIYYAFHIVEEKSRYDCKDGSTVLRYNVMYRVLLLRSKWLFDYSVHSLRYFFTFSLLLKKTQRCIAQLQMS